MVHVKCQKYLNINRKKSRRAKLQIEHDHCSTPTHNSVSGYFISLGAALCLNCSLYTILDTSSLTHWSKCASSISMLSILPSTSTSKVTYSLLWPVISRSGLTAPNFCIRPLPAGWDFFLAAQKCVHKMQRRFHPPRPRPKLSLSRSDSILINE